MQEDSSNTPKPAAPKIRPITVKPTTPATPPASPAAPAATPAESDAPATIRLKPVIPRPAAPAAPAAPPPAAPPAAAPAAAPSAEAPTVRIKPLAPKTPLTPLGTPQPGGAPITGAAKPLKPEQVQAAKSKTSRISLDAALLGAQDDGRPKTIRLKRPTDAPVGKITSHLGPAADAATGDLPQRGRHVTPLIPPIKQDEQPVINRFTQAVEIPDAEVKVRRTGEIVAPGATDPKLAGTAVLPTDPELQADDSSIARRKTIRVRRPGQTAAPGITITKTDDSADETEAAEAAAPTEFSIAPAPVAKTHWFFPVVAIAALFVMIALLVVQLAQDKEIANPTIWPPNAPSVQLPGMAPFRGETRFSHDR